MGGWGDHVYKGMPPVHYGSPFVSPMVTRNVTAVTGACMAVSKKTIEKIGPFDEQFLICGSDVELCIRAEQKGYRNVYDPYVRLYHFESKTRDSYIPEVDFEMSRKMYAPYLAEGDPYYNKQLDLYSCVPKMKAETEEISVEKKIVDEYLHGDYEAGVFNSQEIDTHIAEINPYIFRPSANKNKRINILLPSINPRNCRKSQFYIHTCTSDCLQYLTIQNKIPHRFYIWLQRGIFFQGPETADGRPTKKAGRKVMENKKKTSVWLIVLGGVLAAYGGYLLNGIWEQGIDINTFMERLNMVMARPFGNYFNDTTFKGILLAEFVYMIAIAMYLTSRKNYMPRIVTKRLHLYQSMSEEIFPRSVHLSERRAKTYLSKQHEVP